jgi:hypothetical protein
VNEENCFNSTSIKVSDVAILGTQELPAACANLGSTSTSSAATAAAASESGDLWGWDCDANGRSQLFDTSGSSACPSSSPTAAAGTNGAQGVTDKNGAMAALAVASVVFMLLL